MLSTPAKFSVYSKNENDEYFKTTIEVDVSKFAKIRESFYKDCCEPIFTFEEENFFYADLEYEKLDPLKDDEVQFVMKKEKQKRKTMKAYNAYDSSEDVEAYKFTINRYKKVKWMETCYSKLGEFDGWFFRRYSLDEKETLLASVWLKSLLNQEVKNKQEAEILTKTIDCFKITQKEPVDKNQITSNIINKYRFNYLNAYAKRKISDTTLIGKLKNKINKFDANNPENLDARKVFGLKQVVEDKILDDKTLQEKIEHKQEKRLLK